MVLFFGVCGWNPWVSPFQWKLLSSTFLWYCLLWSKGGSNLSVDEIPKVWPFKMKATEQYFPVALFIMLYKVILTLFRLKIKFWSATIQVKAVVDDYFIMTVPSCDFLVFKKRRANAMDEWALLSKLKTEKRTSFISGKISVTKWTNQGFSSIINHSFSDSKLMWLTFFYSRKYR